ncbi:MAG: hypothetical protein A07HR60_01151 [uncultured archaeon A07HR60]|nr:MAG: hypothetical protein A07HR60_01151 [uncultured archaeon A07HR60]
MQIEHENTVMEFESGAHIERNTSGDRVTFEYYGPADVAIGLQFDDFAKACLYADLQDYVGGFCEEGTGKRGVPPRLAKTGSDTVLMVYYATQHAQGIEWTARFFDAPEKVVRRAIEHVQLSDERAAFDERPEMEEFS